MVVVYLAKLKSWVYVKPTWYENVFKLLINISKDICNTVKPNYIKSMPIPLHSVATRACLHLRCLTVFTYFIDLHHRYIKRKQL